MSSHFRRVEEDSRADSGTWYDRWKRQQNKFALIKEHPEGLTWVRHSKFRAYIFMSVFFAYLVTHPDKSFIGATLDSYLQELSDGGGGTMERFNRWNPWSKFWIGMDKRAATVMEMRDAHEQNKNQ